jgi:hypothetical protein
MMSNKHYDALLDNEGGIFCYLANCKVWSEKVTCGIARFRGGISGTIQLFDVNGVSIVRIKIPKQVESNYTHLVLGSLYDDLAIEIDI